MAIRFDARTNAITTDASRIKFTQPILSLASATGAAGLNLPHGVAPTTPDNGDLWTTTAGLYAEINGGTVGPFGAGGGTVTSTSVVTANGVSGSVATATTTPAITLTLGAITPTTVNGITLTTGGAATDYLNAAGAYTTPAGGSGTVTSSGTPVNNEVAVFATATDINSDSTFTWDGTILTANSIATTATNALSIASTQPRISMEETGLGADLGAWIWNANGGDMALSTATDASPFTPVTDAMKFTRGATTAVTGVAFEGTVTSTGNIVSGSTSSTAEQNVSVLGDSGGFQMSVNTDGHGRMYQLSAAGAQEEAWISMTRNAGVALLYDGTSHIWTMSDGVQVTGTITMAEQADSGSSVATLGQIWVNTATPNELWYTTDAGDDIQITSGTGLAAGGIGGSVTDNQVAVGAATADDIEGSASFTYVDSTRTLNIGTSVLSGNIDLHDQGTISIRNNADGDSGSISHLGSVFKVDADVSSLNLWSTSDIELRVDTGQIIEFTDGTGSGNWTWDSATQISFSQAIRLPDSKSLVFGTGSDFSMNFDATDMQFTAAAGVDVDFRVNAGESAIIMKPNGEVELFHNNIIMAETKDRAASGSASGFSIKHADDVFYDAGFNVVPPTTVGVSANFTLGQSGIGKSLLYNTATARSCVINSTTTIPIGAMYNLKVGPSAGVCTVDGGASVVLRWWNGTSWTDTAAAGNITAGEGEYTIWKESLNLWWVTGPALS